MEWSQGNGDAGDCLQVRHGGVYDALGLQELEQRTEEAHPLYEKPGCDPAQDAKAKILNFLMTHIWGNFGDETPLYQRLMIAHRRFCVLTFQLRPDLVSNASMSKLAGLLGCSRATLSRIAVLNHERIGLYSSAQKSVGARETYKTSAKEGWATRRQIYGSTGMQKPKTKSKGTTPAQRITEAASTSSAVLLAADYAEKSRQAAVRSEASALRALEAASRAEVAQAALEER